MEEIRINNIVELNFSNNITLRAKVINYSANRIDLRISNDDVEKAKQIELMENLLLVAHTDFGLKKTYSSVISPLNEKKQMSIENNPTIRVIQKREFVRVASDMNFKIRKDYQLYNCTCIDISGGGIAFTTKEVQFKQYEDVQVMLSSDYFDKDICVNATILKIENDRIVAKYKDIGSFDESKIIKYVFKQSANKMV